MLISVKKRFVFIANSKTASTSIETALVPYAEINRMGSPQRKHISWKMAKEEYDFLFKFPEYSPESFFKFGVIREPVEWVLSWYNYRLGNQNLPNAIPLDMTFYRFWKSIDRIKDVSQKAHFVDDDEVCRFDLIIPYEKVSQAFPAVMKSLGIRKVVLPAKNISAGQKLVRKKLKADMISEINEYYHQDYELWMEWKNKIGGYLEESSKE